MRKEAGVILQSPGRRMFLLVGGLLVAGSYFWGKAEKEQGGVDQVKMDSAKELDPDSVTVDSTRVKIGASNL